MNKVLLRPLFRKIYLEKTKQKLPVKKFNVGGLSKVEKRNLLLTPITSALLQARKAPGESELGALARTLGQGMSQVPTVASQIADINDDDAQETFEFIADENLPEELKGKGAYQRSTLTGEYKKVGREKEVKEKDTFKILSPEEALEKYGNAFNSDLIYEVNEATGKTNILGKSGTTVNVGGEQDSYSKEMGKEMARADVEEFSSTRKLFNNAQEVDDLLDQIDAVLELPESELKTGALAELRLSADKIAAAFGIDTDFQAVGPAELLNTLSSRITIDKLQGFSGAISNKELDYVANASQGLRMSRDGIKLNNMLQRKANEINRKFYLEVVEPFMESNQGFQGRKDGKTYEQLKAEFRNQNPLVTDDIREAIAATQNIVDAEFEDNIVTDPVTGQKFIKIGENNYVPYEET